MNHTEKIKTLPKNSTRKRCPTGERWDKKENKCKSIIDIQVVPKRAFLGCSKDYIPTTSTEIQRMNDLKELLKTRKISTTDLRNMVSDLIGEERGINKNQILGARLSDELIRLIICLEGNARSNSEIMSKAESKSVDKSQVESPVKSQVESPVKSPVESEEDNVDTNIKLKPEEQILQNNIGIEPADIDSKEHNQYLFNKEKLEYTHSTETTSYDFLYPDLNDPNFNTKIASRKEFNDTQFDGKITDIKKMISYKQSKRMKTQSANLSDLKTKCVH